MSKVVRRELCGGASLDTIFESFDEEPLGSATVAQVRLLKSFVLLWSHVVAVSWCGRKVARFLLQYLFQRCYRNMTVHTLFSQNNHLTSYPCTCVGAQGRAEG